MPIRICFNLYGLLQGISGAILSALDILFSHKFESLYTDEHQRKKVNSLKHSKKQYMFVF